MSSRLQQSLQFPQRGGKRKGAGRKPKGRRAGVSHTKREKVWGRHPIHVTLRVEKYVWNLRTRRAMRVITRAFAYANNRFGMRLIQFSVQGDHLHLIVEADGNQALTRGMKGLSVRIARGLNTMMGRTGRVFADRFHIHVLRSIPEVRNAVRYVKENSRIHAERLGREWREKIDRFAGGPCAITFLQENQRLVVQPLSWLLRQLWLPP